MEGSEEGIAEGSSTIPLSTTVPVVFSDHSSGKIWSLHCYCIAPYLSWVLSSILCSCLRRVV